MVKLNSISAPRPRAGRTPRELRAARLDERLVRLARGRGAVDVAIGYVLLALMAGDRLIRLGFSSMVDYARERLGLPARTAWFLTRLARELMTRPLLRLAVIAGAVSPRKAMVVMRAAVGADEPAYVFAAMTLRLADLEALVREEGSEGIEEFDVEKIALRMTPEQQDRLDAALEVGRELEGYDKARHILLEIIAAEWLSSHAEYGEDSGEDQGECGPTDAVSDAYPENGIAEWQIPAADLQRQLDRIAEAHDLLDAGELPADLDPAELDARARRLMEARLGFDEPLGRLLRQFFDERGWKVLGYASQEEYCRERLGLAARTVRQRIWLERKMDALPALRHALAAGVITYTKALLVAKDATPEDVRERIEEVGSTTWQQAEQESTEEEDRQNRARGVRCIWGPRDILDLLLQAIGCAQAYYSSLGESISAGEALARMADHFVATWTEYLKQRKTSSKRREVLMRTGGLCAMPGCSRAAVHDHHIDFRSHGGSDELSNRVGLCQVCHLRGVHKGYLEVVGRAGELLRFRVRGPLREILGDWWIGPDWKPRRSP